MMRPWLKLTYYTKIQFSLWVFILLPLAAASILSYGTIERIVVDKVNNARQNVVNVVAEDLNKNIEDILYAENLIAYGNQVLLADLRSFKDVAEISRSEEYRSNQNISNFMDIAFSKTSGLNAPVFLVNNRGYITFAANNPLDYESLRQWLEQLADQADHRPHRNAVFWLQSTPLRLTFGPRSETYYFAVRGVEDPNTRDRLGTLYVGIPHAYFRNLFVNAGSGAFDLYDQNGGVIYQSPREDEARLAASGLRYEKVLSKSQWRLVHTVATGGITGELSRLFRSFALLLGACILVFLFISIFIARSLHRPLNKLRRTAEQFGGGNRLVRFPARGSDEIAILGTAFNRMLDQINQLIANVEQEQEEKRMIELHALFSQIRPHFLLNTLNSIKCNLLLSDDQVHSRQLDALMSLLRAYMRVHEPGALAEECKLLQDYVEIMNMRGGMNIRLSIGLPAELRNLTIPKLILQPLVENAIIHGFAEPGETDQIWIEVSRKEDRCEIEVRDNGSGLSRQDYLAFEAAAADRPDSAAENSGIGLGNIRRRLKLTYGPQADLRLREVRGGAGAAFVLHIPLKVSQPERSALHV